MEIYLLSFLIPLIFLLAALLTAWYPPKKINGVYGYRTKRSMAGEEQWQFAQKRSVLHMIWASLTVAAAGWGVAVIFPEPEWSVIIILAQTFLIPAYVYYRTEKELKALA